MSDSKTDWEVVAVSPNGPPIIELNQPVMPTQSHYSHGGQLPLIQENPNQVYLSQHNEQKALRKAAKEQQAFFQEDQEYMEKDRLHAWIRNVQIFPLPKRQVVEVQAPVEVFPNRAKKWIQDISGAFGAHSGIAVALLLGFVSILLRGQFKVTRHKNHVELVTLYLLIMMVSGRMKSPLMEEVLRPIVAIEKRLQSSFFEK